MSLIGCALSLALAVNPAPHKPGLPSEPGTDGPVITSSRPVGVVLQGTAVRNLDTGTTYGSIQAALADPATLDGHTLEVQEPFVDEGQVVVDKSVTLRGQTGTEVVRMSEDTGSVGDDRAWFLVLAGVSLTVRDLIFDGNAFKVHQAFRHRGSGTFEDCVFRDIRYEQSGPAFAGTAIVAMGGSVAVRRCHFEQIGRVGVLLYGTGVTAGVIEDSTFLGQGAGTYLNYGFEVGAGALATLRRNTVSACRGESNGFGSSGMLVSTFFGPGTEALIERNTVLDNAVGLIMGYNSQDSSDVEARFNRIVTNDLGVGNGSAGVTVQAENNWWGCNAGPGDPDCDGIEPLVDADPWLVLEITADPTSLFAGEASAVETQLIRNSDGIDVSPQGTLPDGVPVVFGATLGAVAPSSGVLIAGEAVTAFTAGPVPGIGTVSASVDNQTVSTDITIAPLADLAVTKTAAPAVVQVGQPLTYTITVTNNGPSTATNVTLVDSLPASVTVQSIDPAAQCSLVGNVVTCGLGDLAAGSSVVVTIVVVPTATGALVNTVEVAADETDPVMANNEAQASAAVGLEPIPVLGPVGLAALLAALGGLGARAASRNRRRR